MSVSSAKNPVFVYLFRQRYNAQKKALNNPLVTLDEVANAISAINNQEDRKLSTKNPANFIKDYLRSKSRNANWPVEIRNAGYTATQATGDGNCFRFVPMCGSEPFPDDFTADGAETRFTVQTLSLPVATREILRRDEQSLAQIAVKLHILEHFLSEGPRDARVDIVELVHLQNNVKLRTAEIDALYQVTAMIENDQKIGLLTVEVKIGDPIIREQIEAQVRSALGDAKFDFCIPALLTREKAGEVLAIRFKPIFRNEIPAGDDPLLLTVAYSAIYEFSPSLPRI